MNEIPVMLIGLAPSLRVRRGRWGMRQGRRGGVVMQEGDDDRDVTLAALRVSLLHNGAGNLVGIALLPHLCAHNGGDVGIGQDSIDTVRSYHGDHIRRLDIVRGDIRTTDEEIVAELPTAVEREGGAVPVALEVLITDSTRDTGVAIEQATDDNTASLLDTSLLRWVGAKMVRGELARLASGGDDNGPAIADIDGIQDLADAEDGTERAARVDTRGGGGGDGGAVEVADGVADAVGEVCMCGEGVVGAEQLGELVDDVVRDGVAVLGRAVAVGDAVEIGRGSVVDEVAVVLEGLATYLGIGSRARCRDSVHGVGEGCVGDGAEMGIRG